jgi:hypothetical protein
MSYINQNAEVSNKLIIIVGVLIVLVLLAVPLGFALWPRITKLLWPNRMVLIWEEDFNDFHESNWSYYDKLLEVVDTPGRKGDKCGFINPSFDGVARPILARPPLRIELDVMVESFPWNGKTGTSEIPCFVADMMRLRTPNAACLLMLCVEGFAEFGGSRLGEHNTCQKKKVKWSKEKWYHVIVDYDQDEKNYTVTTRFANTLLGTMKRPLAFWQKEWKEPHLLFSAGMGKCCIDNICVRGVRE